MYWKSMNLIIAEPIFSFVRIQSAITNSSQITDIGNTIFQIN